MPGEYAVVSPEKLLAAADSTLQGAGAGSAAPMKSSSPSPIGAATFPIRDILDCKMAGIQIVDIVGFFERQTGRINVDALNPSTLVFADGFIQAVLKTYLHRAVDLLISL